MKDTQNINISKKCKIMINELKLYKFYFKLKINNKKMHKIIKK